jgi:hypothetical protein
MSTATERIPVLVTKTQKERLTARAKAAGLSTGEYLRRAGDAYSPEEDNALLEGLLAQVTKTTLQAERAIDEALAYVEASEKRITGIEAGHGEQEAA